MSKTTSSKGKGKKKQNTTPSAASATANSSNNNAAPTAPNPSNPQKAGKSKKGNKKNPLDDPRLQVVRGVLESQPEPIRNPLINLTLSIQQHTKVLLERKANVLNLERSESEFPNNLHFQSVLKMPPKVATDPTSIQHKEEYNSVLAKAKIDLKQIQIKQHRHTITLEETRRMKALLTALTRIAGYYYTFSQPLQLPHLEDDTETPPEIYGAIATALALETFDENHALFKDVLNCSRAFVLSTYNETYTSTQDNSSILHEHQWTFLKDKPIPRSPATPALDLTSTLNAEVDGEEEKEQTQEETANETPSETQEEPQQGADFHLGTQGSTSSEESNNDALEEEDDGNNTPTESDLYDTTETPPAAQTLDDDNSSFIDEQIHYPDILKGNGFDLIKQVQNKIIKAISSLIVGVHIHNAQIKAERKAARATATAVQKSVTMDLGTEIEQSLSKEPSATPAELLSLIDQRLDKKLTILQKKDEQTKKQPAKNAKGGTATKQKRKQRAPAKGTPDSEAAPPQNKHQKRQNAPDVSHQYLEYRQQQHQMQYNPYYTAPPPIHWTPAYHPHQSPHYPQPYSYSTPPHQGEGQRRGRGDRGRGRSPSRGRGRGRGGYNRGRGRGRGRA